MPMHPDGGWEMPEKVDLHEVSFCHESLFADFKRWLAARHLELMPFPEGCREEPGQPVVVSYIISISDSNPALKTCDNPPAKGS